MKNVALKTCILLFGIITFAQGPWTREKGKFFTQIGFSSINYDRININDVNFDTNNNYFDYTIQSYTEYGLTDKIEIQAILPFKYLGYENKNGTNKQKFGGLGNISLGGKYKIMDKNLKLSAGLLVSLNTIFKDDNEGLRTGFESNTIHPYITLGQGINKFYYYGNLGFGYMDNGFSDFVRLNLEAGYEVIPKGHLIFVIDLKQPIEDKSTFFDNDKFSYFSTANYLDRQAYSAIGIKANYEVVKDKFGVNLGVFGAASSKNIPQAPSINLSTYFKF